MAYVIVDEDGSAWQARGLTVQFPTREKAEETLRRLCGGDGMVVDARIWEKHKSDVVEGRRRVQELAALGQAFGPNP